MSAWSSNERLKLSCPVKRHKTDIKKPLNYFSIESQTFMGHCVLQLQPVPKVMKTIAPSAPKRQPWLRYIRARLKRFFKERESREKERDFNPFIRSQLNRYFPHNAAKIHINSYRCKRNEWIDLFIGQMKRTRKKATAIMITLFVGLFSSCGHSGFITAHPPYAILYKINPIACAVVSNYPLSWIDVSFRCMCVR